MEKKTHQLRQKLKGMEKKSHQLRQRVMKKKSTPHHPWGDADEVMEW